MYSASDPGRHAQLVAAAEALAEWINTRRAEWRFESPEGEATGDASIDQALASDQFFRARTQDPLPAPPHAPLPSAFDRAFAVEPPAPSAFDQLAAHARSGELDAVISYWNWCARLEAQGHRQLIGVGEAMQGLGDLSREERQQKA